MGHKRKHPLLPFPAVLEGLAKGKRGLWEVAEEQKKKRNFGSNLVLVFRERQLGGEGEV